MHRIPANDKNKIKSRNLELKQPNMKKEEKK